MRGSKILITGPTGQIATPIARALAAENEVWGIARFTNPAAREGLEKDLFLQRTGTGIHRDDIDISFAGVPFRSMASQGQRKSLLFALRLAEYETLKDAKGFPPLLL